MSAMVLSPTAPRLRLTARGRAVVALLIAVPLAAGAVAFGFGQGAAAQGPAAESAASSASTTGFRYVTVHDGESLWSVAQRIAPQSDPRDVIAEIVDLNQLPSTAVQSGDRLAIPATYSR